jgi:hypothetical protein
MSQISRSPKHHQTQDRVSHSSHHGPHVSEFQLQLLNETNETNDPDANDTNQWTLDPAIRCVGLAGVKEARQYLVVKAKRTIAKAS